jgi:hypothetical protein
MARRKIETDDFQEICDVFQEIREEIARDTRPPWFSTTERQQRVQRTYESGVFGWLVRQARRYDCEECYQALRDQLFAWDPNLEH